MIWLCLVFAPALLVALVMLGRFEERFLP